MNSVSVEQSALPSLVSLCTSRDSPRLRNARVVQRSSVNTALSQAPTTGSHVAPKTTQPRCPHKRAKAQVSESRTLPSVRELRSLNLRRQGSRFYFPLRANQSLTKSKARLHSFLAQHNLCVGGTLARSPTAVNVAMSHPIVLL